jgi:secretion/DNA translocation related TadE-like protein
VIDGGAEEGSATVWVLMACFVVAAVGAVVVALSIAVQTRHRAAGSADAAALAAASAALRSDPCAAADAVAADDGAELTGCVLRDGVVLVHTRVVAERWLEWAGAASGVARAGPAPVDLRPAGVRRSAAAHGPRPNR